ASGSPRSGDVFWSEFVSVARRMSLAERADHTEERPRPMNFRIPLYVFQHKAGYTARPLFAASPERTDANLNRLLTKLTRDLVSTLEALGRKERHDEAAAWAFCPTVTTHRT